MQIPGEVFDAWRRFTLEMVESKQASKQAHHVQVEDCFSEVTSLFPFFYFTFDGFYAPTKQKADLIIELCFTVTSLVNLLLFVIYM